MSNLDRIQRAVRAARARQAPRANTPTAAMPWAEVEVEVDWLRAGGMSPDRIARALGTTCANLARRAGRHGRADIARLMYAEAKWSA